MRTDYQTKPEDRDESDGVHPTKTVGKFAKDMKKKGFKFIGPTSGLSFMQAVGLVNHHRHSCFAFQQIEAARKSSKKNASSSSSSSSSSSTSARAKRDTKRK